MALRAEYKHEISVGQAGQTLFAFLLLAPIIGLVIGGVTAALASAGLPRPVPAAPGPVPAMMGGVPPHQATHEVTVDAGLDAGPPDQLPANGAGLTFG